MGFKKSANKKLIAKAKTVSSSLSNFENDFGGFDFFFSRDRRVHTENEIYAKTECFTKYPPYLPRIDRIIAITCGQHACTDDVEFRSIMATCHLHIPW